MNRLVLCALFLVGSVASAQTRSSPPEFSGLDRRIEAAQRQPSNARLALDATRALRDVLRASTDAGGREEAMLRVSAVESLVDQAISANPREAPLLLMEKASLVFNAGRKGEVEALVRASMEAGPNLDAALALLGIHDRRGERDQIFPICARVRPQLFREAQVWQLLHACMKHSGASTIASGLSWASEGDRAFYLREMQRRTAATKP
ncbi:hypothetical protein F0U62_08695 [Cystobacter fuscus]|uniref:hypothetical protein n=1 Tax=Cystobacter fuscus TaxID=43 RepID=UPI002B31AE8E|nr:hypothetical protein F0U62_08695 [Cystobacter fuscus]